MRKLLIAGSGVLVLASSAVDGQGPNIDHRAVACVVADKFPRFDARFASADTVATARVVFQPEKSEQWWAVPVVQRNL